MKNSAIDNEMCAVCRKIRIERYRNCTQICLALQAYQICVSGSQFDAEAKRGISAIKQNNAWMG